MILDVGCGDKSIGDINCDLYKDYEPNAESLVKINTTHNFIQCDGQHLPFQNNTFDKVYCSHVIEHVKNPYLLLKELYRVSNKTVIIKCPHRFSHLAKRHNHKHFLTITWFVKTLSFLQFPYKLEFSHRHLLNLLALPEEITVTIQK